jgi:hypothetical protein
MIVGAGREVESRVGIGFRVRVTTVGRGCGCSLHALISKTNPTTFNTMISRSSVVVNKILYLIFSPLQ